VPSWIFGCFSDVWCDFFLNVGGRSTFCAVSRFVSSVCTVGSRHRFDPDFLSPLILLLVSRALWNLENSCLYLSQSLRFTSHISSNWPLHNNAVLHRVVTGDTRNGCRRKRCGCLCRECSGRRPAIGKDDMASGEILLVGVAALYCLPRVDGVDRAEGSSNTRAPQWRAAMVRRRSAPAPV
jgi:hypothetical protein